MESVLREAVRSAVCDYIEIVVEENIKEKIVYFGKELEDIGKVSDCGGYVRVLVNNTFGFASFNNIDKLKSSIEVAQKNAKLIPSTNKIRLIPQKQIRDYIYVKSERDARKILLEEKFELIKKYNELVLNYPNIQTSHITYRDIYKKRYYVNSDDTFIYQEKVDNAIRISAIAAEGSNIQVAMLNKGKLNDFSVIENLEQEIEEVAKRAVELLHAEPIKKGIYTCIFDQALTGLFTHEAFGHLSEADFLYENKELQNLMRLGRRFGKDFLNIVDDGTIKDLQGSAVYDDEGVRTTRTYLIKNGVFNAHLHSKETAGVMNEELTGNARTIDYRFPPIVRMTNTFIEPIEGGKSFDEMVAEIKEGVYIKGARGGQTECEMFSFTAEYGYLIKNGKLDKLLRDIPLSGNVFTTLMNIEEIGNDLQLYGGVGGCGKEGQFPLPISDGGPHIKVKDVLIGGK